MCNPLHFAWRLNEYVAEFMNQTTLVSEDLAMGRLVRAGAEMWDIPIEIRLFRPREPQSSAAERFWTIVKGTQGSLPKKA
jgi:hypothetical protein